MPLMPIINRTPVQMFTHSRINSRFFSKQAHVSIPKQFRARKTSWMSTFNSLRSDERLQDRTSDTSPGKPQYRLIEDVEDLDRYRVGGYHPLEIGDRLHCGRYQLVDKLGYGGYSTTWLARDLQNARYVAVKVIVSDASERNSEASLLHFLWKSSYRPGKEILPHLIDEFWITGPNGKHRCIVTFPAQMSLFDAKEASTFGLFRPKVAQSIIAQLIRGVAFLHHENIVHGGKTLFEASMKFPG